MDGQVALDLLAKTPVDLVLLDINMPVLDGFATLAKIRENPEWKDMVVIMVTAVDKIEAVAECIQKGLRITCRSSLIRSCSTPGSKPAWNVNFCVRKSPDSNRNSRPKPLKQVDWTGRSYV